MPKGPLPMNEDNNVNISPNNENIEVETVNADLTDTQNISTPQKDNKKWNTDDIFILTQQRKINYQ